jgi:hypothetical protein
MSFGQMFNVQRLLGKVKIIALADRMARADGPDVAVDLARRRTLP